MKAKPGERIEHMYLGPRNEGASFGGTKKIDNQDKV